jgi:hypothetical protein
MYVVLDQEYALPEEVTQVQSLAVESRRITLGLLRYIKRTLEEQSSSTREPTPVYRAMPGAREGHVLPHEFIKTP